MTEAEWLASNDPGRMLQFLGLWVNRRKARYFTREVLAPLLPPLFDEDAGEWATAALDRWADGPTEARPTPLIPAWVNELRTRDANEFPLIITQRLGLPNPPRGNWRPIDPRHPDRRMAQKVTRLGPPERTSGLLREVFGNPVAPVAFSPTWRTSTTLALGQGMYDARDFSAMPILADALQDAGCEDAAILDHCRGPGPHVRGCWVVDLVLGKE